MGTSSDDNHYFTCVEAEGIATVVAEAIVSVDEEHIFVVRGCTRSPMMREVGKRIALKVASEGIRGRVYAPEGTLVSRRLPGTVIKDPDTVAERTVEFDACESVLGCAD